MSPLLVSNNDQPAQVQLGPADLSQAVLDGLITRQQADALWAH